MTERTRFKIAWDLAGELECKAQWVADAVRHHDWEKVARWRTDFEKAYATLLASFSAAELAELLPMRPEGYLRAAAAADAAAGPLSSDSLTVPCKFCHQQVSAKTAHLHQGQWVGDECCWDERLWSSE